MKRILLVLLCLLLITNTACCEIPATPTDLDELYETIEDDDFGYIEHFDRKVFLDYLKRPSFYEGEEIILVAILVDFKPTDIYTFDWEYSEDSVIWYIIQDAHEQTYTFILDQDTRAYWWRVKVTIQEESL